MVNEGLPVHLVLRAWMGLMVNKGLPVRLVRRDIPGLRAWMGLMVNEGLRVRLGLLCLRLV